MSEDIEDRILLKHFPGYSPEMWHQIAWNWNWDNGIEPLKWIISQPNCDKGTALLIYWYSAPRFDAQYASREEVDKYELDKYDFTKEIENKYVSGFYQKENFSFDPHNDEGHDWTTEYSNYPLKQPIPEIMYQATKGKKLTKMRLDEGYPPEVWKEATEALERE